MIINTLDDKLWCKTNTCSAMSYQGTSFVSISRPSVSQVSADQTPESIDLLQMVPETGRVHTYPETGRVHTYPETDRVHTHPETDRVHTYPETRWIHTYPDTGRVHTSNEDPKRSADYETPPHHGRVLLVQVTALCYVKNIILWLELHIADVKHNLLRKFEISDSLMQIIAWFHNSDNCLVNYCNYLLYLKLTRHFRIHMSAPYFKLIITSWKYLVTSW